MKREAQELEALHLVALAIDARKKEGTPAHGEALALSEEAKRIWKKQLWAKQKCPHCGQAI